MHDTMEATLADVTAAEEEAIKTFDGLMAAKNKDDTAKALAEDKKFLAELTKGCATKEAEWAERCKIRADEILAISDTIKILNDDDALDLFKKTLPSPSLIQVQDRSRTLRQRAMVMLQ